MALDEQFVRFPGHEYPQLLPTVDEIVLGEPAPWDVLPVAQRTGLTLERVRQRLIDAGRSSHRHDWTSDSPEFAALSHARADSITRRSAVLVALFEEDGETHVVLTRRAFQLRHHRGEIAFPGGRGEDGEIAPETATREAHEEVGIAPDTVEVVGWLTPLATLASGSAIWPVVGVLPGRPDFVTDPIEVDRAFCVTLADLAADGAYRQERWRRLERRPGADEAGFVTIHLYRVPEDLVWGATARILTELLCVVTGVEWPDAQRVWA